MEAISRNSPLKLEEPILKKLALINTDADALFVLQTIKKIEDLGFAVVYQGNTKKISKTIKKLDKDFAYLAIIGKNEELGEDIKIRDISTRKEVTLEEIISLNNQSVVDEKIITQDSSETIKSIVKVMRDYLKTGDFDRERLLELISLHTNANGNIYLSGKDIEALIIEVGEAYRERGIINEIYESKTIEE